MTNPDGIRYILADIMVESDVAPDELEMLRLGVTRTPDDPIPCRARLDLFAVAVCFEHSQGLGTQVVLGSGATFIVAMPFEAFDAAFMQAANVKRYIFQEQT